MHPTGLIPLGARFDERYTIENLIGGGSFGVIYSAWDHDDQCWVALKTLNVQSMGTAELVTRFEREAEICAQLRCPHTAQFRQFGFAAETKFHPRLPYMVFELVQGVSLGTLLAIRPGLSMVEAVHVMVGLLDSIGEAHSLGILHRDIKPDNVMVAAPPERCSPPEREGSLAARLGIPDGADPVWHDVTALQVKVVDFGLGKLLQTSAREYVAPLTRAGIATGTVAYMSPELLLEQDVDYRTDLYSAGMMFYRCIAGRDAYPGNNIADVVGGHLYGPVPPLPEDLGTPSIQRFWEKSVAKKPAERFENAAEMSWALRTAWDPSLRLQPKPVVPPPPAIERPSWFAGALSRMRRGLGL